MRQSNNEDNAALLNYYQFQHRLHFRFIVYSDKHQ